MTTEQNSPTGGPGCLGFVLIAFIVLTVVGACSAMFGGPDEGGMVYSCSEHLGGEAMAYDPDASFASEKTEDKYDVYLLDADGNDIGTCAVEVTDESYLVRGGTW